ncbi:hypothetical protein [Actinoplanes aureus]|uniref:Uncharacterized protein n=1 Tax=Actinoplanes aureus TaxID=2792083 RepID=A0A931CJG0_9ACTN|nr:hypothetical protein [Actinoplanes aureus]MBG0567521.1 hypothetical protein [Actinoplanes aureus]
MSRHELVPLDESIDCVAVGWEKGLGTYFFQMYKTDNDCPFDAPDDELGCTFAQVTRAANLIDEVKKYAHIPDDLQNTLTADAQREGVCGFPNTVLIMNAIPEPDPVNWDEIPIPF